MAVTNFSPLLGLALPTTGDLSGTWGVTVNDSITSLLDTAVAGTTTLSTDGDVTLSTTNGAANQARSATLLCTGARTALRTITAPAQSKAYVVINQTTGGFAVKVVGSGPTTGVTIANGEKALIAWDGSDFVLVSAIPIDLTTDVTGTLPTANGGTGLTGFTASNNALYSTSSSALTAGTLPILAGGTGATTNSGARTNLGATTVGSNFFTLANPSAVTFPRVNADNTVSTLDASNFRTAIGATTVGGSMFTLTNPSAVTFPRFNADNTVSALDAATFRTAIGAGTGGGTVSSVTVSAGSGLSGGGTVTTSGTITLSNAGVTSLGAGTGISLSGSTGGVTVTNSGVTSVSAGSGISVSASTGGVTISASGGSSYVFLGRVALGNGVGTASISLPAGWQNTYDAIAFTVRGYVFAAFGGIPAGHILIDNVTSGFRYIYSAGGAGGNSSNVIFSGTNLFNLLATVSNNYGVSVNGFINYSGNYDTMISVLIATGGSQSGYVTGAYNNGFVTGAPSSIQWYNGGYNPSTQYYLTGSFTAWGVKNS